MTHTPSLSSLLQRRTITHQAKVRVERLDYDWDPIASVLKTWLAPAPDAKVNDLVAVGATLHKQYAYQFSMDADRMFILSFHINPARLDLLTSDRPVEEHEVLPTAHDYDTKPVGGTDRLLGLFAGRISLTRAITAARSRITNLEPKKSLIALYRPEGIILTQKGDGNESYDSLGAELQAHPETAEEYCTILLPEPQSAHQAIAQEADLDSLLVLTNLFYLSKYKGHDVCWTR